MRVRRFRGERGERKEENGWQEVPIPSVRVEEKKKKNLRGRQNKKKGEMKPNEVQRRDGISRELQQ